MKPAIMPAKFAGTCVACKGGIEKGATIAYEKGVGAKHHPACPAVPAPPPVWVPVPVAPKVAALGVEAAAAAMAAKGEATAAAWKALAAVIEPIGYCASCKGSGYVWHWDCEYPCGTGHLGLEAAVAEAGAIGEALHAAWSEAKAAWEAASAHHRALEAEAAALLAVEKFKVVRVVKGRKVPKGTVGEVIWTGSSNWGPRIGLKTSAGEVHWTVPGNVEVIAVKERVVEAPVPLAA